jgi:hypothetical protein
MSHAVGHDAGHHDRAGLTSLSGPAHTLYAIAAFYRNGLMMRREKDMLKGALACDVVRPPSRASQSLACLVCGVS